MPHLLKGVTIMQTPSKDSIKSSEGKYHVVRHSSYRGGVSEKIEWRVCERINDTMWKLIRECRTRGEAIEFMYIMAKVWKALHHAPIRQNCRYRFSLGFSCLGFHPLDILKGFTMYTITMHQKTQAEGWKPVKTLPIDSPLWDSHDQSWIKTLIDHGTMVITIGYTMYQLNR